MAFTDGILAFFKRILGIGQRSAQGTENPGEVGQDNAGQPGEVAGGRPGEVAGDVHKQGGIGDDPAEREVAPAPGDPTKIE